MKKKTADADLQDLRTMLVQRLGPLAKDVRLITDMPLLDGEMRLTLTGGPLRVTAWGADLAATVQALITKLESAQRTALGEGGGDSPLLPL